MSTSTWAVTAVAHPALMPHPACADCLALADAAITHARVMGSVGATYSVEPRDSDGNQTGQVHSVTVARVIAVIER